MKIHDADKDIERQDKQAKIKRVRHQSIEREHHTYETLTEVIRNEYKTEPQTKFTVRVSKELATNLRVYADEMEMSINQSIIYLCERQFKEKWNTRAFFKLEHPFTVAIPFISQELEKYIENEINCIIDMSHDIDSRLAVQSQLISNNETDYYMAVSFQYGNNYLDVYQTDDECYYSGFKRYHIGLYDIYLEHLETSIFIRVVFEDRNPIKATIITKEDARKQASMSKNQLLIRYIDDIDQKNDFEKVKENIRKHETETQLYIKTLEQRVKTLENELASLKTHADDDSPSHDDNPPEEIQERSSDPLDDVSLIPQMPPETQKTIADAMIKLQRVNNIYQDAIQSSMKHLIKPIMKAHAENMKDADDTSSDDAE